MTLKLHRIIEDLADPDREIQILALTTIPRIANDMSPTQEELDSLNQHLNRLAASRNPDIVFLARKAQNVISRVMQGLPPDNDAPITVGEPHKVVAAPVAPPPPPPPKPVSQSAIPTPPDPINVAAVMSSLGLSSDQMIVRLAQEEDASQLATLLATARGMADERLVEKAIPMLAHPDPRVRANALEVFETGGNEKHLPVLLPLLNDDNNRVKSNAIKAVARFDVSQVKQCLVEMLGSELVSMRESGLYALMNLPVIQDLALVENLIEDPYDSLRMRLVAYLANHPAKEATALLERMVVDKDAPVRDAAVEALVKRCVSVEALLQQAAAPPEPPVPDPHITPPDGIPVQGQPAAELIDPPSRPRGLRASAMVDEAVERGFRATLAQLLKELKSSEKRAILARALYQAGLKGYQSCRRGELKDKEALHLYYEIERYHDFLRDYTRKLNLEDTTVDKLQRQIVVTGLAQYQGRLKVSLVKLGRISAEAAKKGIVELPPELIKEIETLAPPPPEGL